MLSPEEDVDAHFGVSDHSERVSQLGESMPTNDVIGGSDVSHGIFYTSQLTPQHMLSLSV